MSLSDIATGNFDYNTLKSVIGSYDRYKYYMKTPEGRMFLQHLAKYSIPALITSNIQQYTSFGAVENTKRADFQALIGDLLRPNQGFEIIIKKNNEQGKPVEHNIGKLVKQITIPNQVRNTVPFSRCGKDYVLATNRKWENKISVGFYTDANNIYSSSIRELFQDVDEYSYFNSNKKNSNTISLEYRREIDYISSLPTNPTLRDKILHNLKNSAISTMKGALKDKLKAGLNALSGVTIPVEVHGDSTDNMKGLFPTIKESNKKLIFVIKFNDIILETIHGGQYDDERIDNYRIEDMTFTFNRVESLFLLQKDTTKDDNKRMNEESVFDEKTSVLGYTKQPIPT